MRSHYVIAKQAFVVIAEGNGGKRQESCSFIWVESSLTRIVKDTLDLFLLIQSNQVKIVPKMR